MIKRERERERESGRDRDGDGDGGFGFERGSLGGRDDEPEGIFDRREEYSGVIAAPERSKFDSDGEQGSRRLHR